MSDKQKAIDEIRMLMKQHHISLNEISSAPKIQTRENQGSLALKNVFGIIGAIFIFCGLGIYISQHWGEMNSLVRIIITLGTGIFLFILALIAAHDKYYKRIAKVLFVFAAVFETFGMFVAQDELFKVSNIHYAALVIFATLLLQHLLTFWQRPRTMLLFLSILFATALVATEFDLLNVSGDHTAIAIGLSLLLISYALDKTKYKIMTPFWYFIGSGLFLVGIFNVLQHTPIEIVYIGITVFIIFLSTVVRSTALLITGTFAMIGYLGYFTQEHFVHSVGWPLALIFFGILLLGISGMAIKIGKNIKGP